MPWQYGDTFLFCIISVCLDFSQVRLANNEYSLDRRSLYEYETHFTVMVSSVKKPFFVCLRSNQILLSSLEHMIQF